MRSAISQTQSTRLCVQQIARSTRRSPGNPDLEPLRPDFALPVDETIVHGTADAAWASFEEDRLGVLKPGACADLVVIDDDPFANGPGALLAARVRRTVVAGRTVHSNP